MGVMNDVRSSRDQNLEEGIYVFVFSCVNRDSEIIL